MTNDLDGGLSDGTPAVPTAGSSEGTGDSKGSFDAVKLQATLESLTKRLDKVDERSKALQGDKDRGVNKTQEDVKELKRKIAEIEKYKKSGLDEDTAIDELTFRDEVRSLREQLSNLNPVQTQPAGNGKSLADEAANVFEEYQINPNDPDAVSLLELQGVDLVKAVSKLAIKRAKTQTTPDSSEAPSLGSSPASLSDSDAIYAEIGELSKNYSKNEERIKALQKRVGG